ncbi:MAG: hypothetical protein ACLP5H_04345 [Desulfomonilaceae bacterium]
MGTWKSPPKAKIYEALSAVADGRVTLMGGEIAEVVSSDGTKTYHVEWSPDLNGITSNDNASYWQGYMGYPIIAVLMVLGKLQYKTEVPSFLAGVPWKQLNRRFRNDYPKAIDSVLDTLESKGTPRQIVVTEVERIMAQIEGLKLEKLPRRKRPPKKEKVLPSS